MTYICDYTGEECEFDRCFCEECPVMLEMYEKEGGE